MVAVLHKPLLLPLRDSIVSFVLDLLQMVPRILDAKRVSCSVFALPLNSSPSPIPFWDFLFPCSCSFAAPPPSRMPARLFRRIQVKCFPDQSGVTG